MKNLKSIHDIIYFKDWKGKSVKTNITPTIIITMHYQKLKGKRRFKVSSIYSCVILYYNYDARFCKKARYRNIRYSDYTTSTPNNIYVYTWLPFGNVIQCVTYMNIKQIPIYFLSYTTATKHFWERGTTKCLLCPLYVDLLFIHPTIYLCILSVFTRALFFTPNKVFLLFILNLKMCFVISQTEMVHKWWEFSSKLCKTMHLIRRGWEDIDMAAQKSCHLWPDRSWKPVINEFIMKFHRD